MKPTSDAWMQVAVKIVCNVFPGAGVCFFIEMRVKIVQCWCYKQLIVDGVQVSDRWHLNALKFQGYLVILPTLKTKNLPRLLSSAKQQQVHKQGWQVMIKQFLQIVDNGIRGHSETNTPHTFNKRISAIVHNVYCHKLAPRNRILHRRHIIVNWHVIFTPIGENRFKNGAISTAHALSIPFGVFNGHIPSGCD